MGGTIKMQCPTTYTLIANAIGGIPPYTYNYIIYNSVMQVNNMLWSNSLTTNTYIFTQNSAWGTGLITAQIRISDAGTNTATSNTYYLMSPIDAVNCPISPAAAVDVRQQSPEGYYMAMMAIPAAVLMVLIFERRRKKQSPAPPASNPAIA